MRLFIAPFVLLPGLLSGPCLGENTASRSGYFSKMAGVLKGLQGEKRINASSLFDCLARSFCFDEECALSYHENLGRCLYAAVGMFARLRTQCIFEHTPDPSWISFVTTQPQERFGHPLGLWLLDTVCRGRNLGSWGRDKNVEVAGDLVDWNHESKPENRAGAGNFHFLKLEGNYSLRIDLQEAARFTEDQPFSLALWVKANAKKNSMTILEAYNKEGQPAFIMRISTKTKKHLLVRRIGRFTAVLNLPEKNVPTWIHMAVVFSGEQKHEFYINGNNVFVEGRTLSGPRRRFDKLYIGGKLPNHSLIGSAACLAIYKETLSQRRVKLLMDNCP